MQKVSGRDGHELEEIEKVFFKWLLETAHSPGSEHTCVDDCRCKLGRGGKVLPHPQYRHTVTCVCSPPGE